MNTATATKPAVKVRVAYDEDVRSLNPREDSSGSVMAGWHRRYTVGDEKLAGPDAIVNRVLGAGETERLQAIMDKEFKRWREHNGVGFGDLGSNLTADQKLSYRALRERERERATTALAAECVILPVYMLDHSNVALSTTPFGCPWDSGQVGYIWQTFESIRENYRWKVITTKRRAVVAANLKIEVEVYNDWQSGNCYWFETLDEDGEQVDSCGGFIGDDWASIKDHLPANLQDHTKWEFPWH